MVLTEIIIIKKSWLKRMAPRFQVRRLAYLSLLITLLFFNHACVDAPYSLCQKLKTPQTTQTTAPFRETSTIYSNPCLQIFFFQVSPTPPRSSLRSYMCLNYVPNKACQDKSGLLSNEACKIWFSILLYYNSYIYI